MNHNTKRFCLVSLGISSIACFVGAVYPRIFAWNQTATSNTIATQRAANCRIIYPSVQANTIPVDGKSGKPLPIGSHVCDWSGTTAQINGSHAIDFVRVGQSESIASILKSRGFNP